MPGGISGILSILLANTIYMELVDDVIKVSDKGAYDMVKLIALKEGLLVGSSSGAALAAIKLAEKIDRGNIITILLDRGDRYFSKNIY